MLGVVVKAYFVQYKFILPDTVKHSSYTYQKLFRAIYGYTQAVYKGSGKNYRYHRKGVLSNYPYLRPGKNCVIIPPIAFQPLQDFFKTGFNPTHIWEEKGEWKCTYFLNEKDLIEKDAAKAIENLLSRIFIDSKEGPIKLSSELMRVLSKDTDFRYKEVVLKECQKVVDGPWFREVYTLSEELNTFYNNYRSLKDVLSFHKKSI